MRILYVTKESPIQPSGGIGTYIEHMARAMQAAGHEVFLFTWADSEDFRAVLDYGVFKRDNVRLIRVDRARVWRETPIREYALSLATYLHRHIREAIAEWGIDVVEATDFLSPCLPLFQSLQASPEARDVLCVTFNHGFIEDFYEADQIGMEERVQTELLGERQQCRLSDVVVAPSHAAADRLAHYGIRDRVAIMREPYQMQGRLGFREVRHDLTYLGRISISKGIDKLIHFANVTDPVHKWKQIKLIGRIVNTPFRQNDMRAYVNKRLSPDLRDIAFFTDYLPREKALQLLEPGAVCPSLGSAETFSYACVESIDHGLLPVVRHGTPMAEFIPEPHRDVILDERMRSVREIQATFERLMSKADTVLEDVRQHCEETLAPDRVAGEMAALYERKLAEKRGHLAARARGPMTLDDVTVLMPIHGPNFEFAETVDSLVAQTAGPPRLLIVNDGTPPERAEWFAYAETALPDVTVIDQPNTGLLGARNTLIEACETPLALFLDADDMLRGDALEKLLSAWNHAVFDIDAVLPARANFAENGELLLRDLLGDHLHLIDNDFRMTALIRSEVLREIGFDATRRNGEGDDWVFWLEFTGRGHRGMFLPDPVFLYRFRRGSMSWPWSEGQHTGTQAMIRDVAVRLAAETPAYGETIARAMYSQSIRLPERLPEPEPVTVPIKPDPVVAPVSPPKPPSPAELP